MTNNGYFIYFVSYTNDLLNTKLSLVLLFYLTMLKDKTNIESQYIAMTINGNLVVMKMRLYADDEIILMDKAFTSKWL